MPFSLKNHDALQSLLYKACGIVFLGAGLLKLGFARHEFAQLLVQTGAPLPGLLAVAVPLLEILGGLAFCFNRATRLFAPLLALDMLAALLLIGLPGLRGQSQPVGPYDIGAEPWRLPLEIILFITMLRLTTSKK